MYEILAVNNVMRVIDRLVDVRQYPENFRYLNRTRIVNAMDGEIFARFKGRVYAADIISLDGKARVRPAPSVQLQQTDLPILKHGMAFNREQRRMLDRVERNVATGTERNAFIDFVAENLGYLIDGVRTQMNALIAGMMLDSFTYDRLGIKLTGVTWGMPSDLKVTLTGTQLWTATGTAKPVTDLQTMRKTAQQKYGKVLNRVEMSTAAFDAMIRTDEFKNLAASLYAVNNATFVLPVQNMEAMRTLAQNITGIPVIEVDDTQYAVDNLDGTETYTRYLPEADVLFSNSADDNNGRIYDFANAMVEETMPGMVPSLIGDFPDERYGPVGYTTAADPQGNPPGVNLWAVASGFPRKHQEASTARLRVL